MTTDYKEKARQLVYECRSAPTVMDYDKLIDRVAAFAQAAAAERDKQIEELGFWLKQAKDWNLDIEEREAAVCPEDVPFDEYIKVLEKRVVAAAASARGAERLRIEKVIQGIVFSAVPSKESFVTRVLSAIAADPQSTEQEKQNHER